MEAITTIKGLKVQLEPNNIQISKMKMNCGASRWAFNYALNIKKDKFNKKEKIPNNIELHREINKLKGTETLSWAYETGISKCSFQEALRDCDKAFSNFFTRCKKKNIKQKGFPKFKSKKNEKQSESSSGIQACGDGSSEKAISLSLSVKQEFSKKSRDYILKV